MARVQAFLGLKPVSEVTPAAADFAVTISGDSMEPYIRDGETVYVQRDATLAEFDVGVFHVDGDVLCKQFCLDAYRNLHLLSANPAREDANRRIASTSTSSVVSYGKVLLPHKLPKPEYL
jgi:phage repressor protein C with HTH and peptisase S24 domain